MIWFLLIITLVPAAKTCKFSFDKEVNTDPTFCGIVPKTCEDTKYRSFDGSCNNLEHPWWGTPGVPYKRLPCSGLLTLDDKSLPNPRTISLRSFVDLEAKDNLWTILFMQYGQAVAHDISLTKGVAQTKKNAVICCANGQLTEAARRDPRCAPVSIPEDDPFYAPQNITCMDFYRVETTQDTECINAPELPQPLNAVTAALDLSIIYGSDINRAEEVRAFEGGRLASVFRNGQEVLPQDPTPRESCNVNSDSEPCFFSGDVRVNQNPQLALLHNIYMQHHNYIAGKLAEVNPHWADETLFQETRRIEIALHQCIIYTEYLEGILGTEYMIKNNLTFPNATDFIDDYDPTVNFAPSNAYATVAFRVFHTEIEGMLKSILENRNTSNIIRLSDWYNKPSICEQGRNFIGLTLGMATQGASAIDRFLTVHVLELLFKDGLLGQDLRTIDIQRGRDQGICSYPAMLREMGVADPKSFEDFTEFMDPANAKILQDLYRDIEKVELGPAMFLERRQPRALSSPLGQAITGDQFRRLRVGDRCFFENGRGKCAFTKDQLNEIRRICSITNILCTNGEVKEMQPQGFKKISEKNPLKNCNSYPVFNPLPWKENISN